MALKELALYTSIKRALVDQINHCRRRSRAGMRGTLPTHQIVGMATAYKLSKQRMHEDLEHITQCQNSFFEKALESG